MLPSPMVTAAELLARLRDPSEQGPSGKLAALLVQDVLARPVRELLDPDDPTRANVALGTDSRVTGSRDLLDELRVARGAMLVSAAELFGMVTDRAAALPTPSTSW